ncbi:hypothetical protein FDUTEX481_09094 [Tolypothrix sp. PCC 7601]|nr:hypothetical protein FDUTEX481_09094 [Tolypothrix sp. PCC 7601]
MGEDCFTCSPFSIKSYLPRQIISGIKTDLAITEKTKYKNYHKLKSTAGFKDYSSCQIHC